MLSARKRAIATRKLRGVVASTFVAWSVVQQFPTPYNTSLHGERPASNSATAVALCLPPTCAEPLT